MVHALLVLAAEEAEPSKTALLRGRRRCSPPGPWCWASSACAARSSRAASSGARGVIAISAVLVVAAMAAAVLTS